MENKGFTLTELLAVIAIIAILSIAAISGYSTMTRNGKEKTLKTKVDAIENAAYKFAKENNIDRKTTISVNKLVVLGYLQADESSDEGLSMYLNPVTGDNMICNTIDLVIANNDVIVKYNTTKKNCSLANEEEDSAKIKVTGYCSSSNVLTLTGDTFSWTNCNNVYIRTNPNGLDLNKIESITFDYDGNSIVKKTGDIASSNSTDTNRYKNVVAVSGIDNQVVTTDVGITYTMKDGKVYFRHVIVRIDKQKPTLTNVLKNNTKIGAGGVQERSFEVYVDDANGSGAHGFYVSRSAATGSARYETTNYKKTISAPLGIWYLIPKDSVGNIGEPKVTTVENVPGNLSCIMSLFKNDKRTGVARSNNWYNYDIAVREHSEAYSNGVSYGILKATPITNRSQLPNYASENEVINHFFNPTQTAEMEITKFYGGLWNVQHKGVTVCTIDVGIDKTRPTISLSPDHHDTHEQFHNVVITITDPGTVVSGFYKSGKDEMRSGSPKYELKYAWVKNGTSQASVTNWKTVYPTKVEPGNLINTNTTNKLIYKIENERVDYTGTKMTGSYRLIVLSDTLQDLAGNYNIGTTSGIYKMDNTPPKCETDGGNPNWVNYSLTLVGKCTDQEGTTDQSGCVSDISKLYDYEINSDHETPGTVYDNADNFTLCDNDQHTHIDITKPTCTHSGDSTSWTSGNRTIAWGCSDTGGSNCDPSYSGSSKVFDSTTKTSTIGSYEIRDVAKNTFTCSSRTANVYVDKTDPYCEITDRRDSWSKDGADFSVSCSDGESGLSKCAGNNNLNGPSSNKWNKTGKQESDNYTAKDKVGHDFTCKFTIQTRTRYKKRSWNSCKTGSTCGDYTSWTQSGVKDHAHTQTQCSSFESTSTLSKTECSTHESFGGYWSCHCINYSRKCVDTCKGDWDEWTKYNYDSCTESYHDTDCGSRTEYK